MNLFAGAWESRDVTPLPVDIPQATGSQVSQSRVLFNITHYYLYNLRLQSIFSLAYSPALE